MPAAVFYDATYGDMLDGVHDLKDDTLKVALINGVPSTGHNTWSQISGSEITAGIGTGYETAGGVTITQSLSTDGPEGTITASNVAITASGTDLGPFRYVVLYNDSAASDQLICYWDNTTNITILDGGTFTLAFGSFVVKLA